MRITDKHVFFFGTELSNFHPCKITYNFGDEVLTFKSSEHMFMWLKAQTFNDEEAANKILNAEHPHIAKRAGREIKKFDEAVWTEKRKEAMKIALRYKFSDENPRLKSFLMNPRFDGKKFAETSLFDRIWGIGMTEFHKEIDNEEKWRGENLLGICLNEIREELLNK